MKAMATWADWSPASDRAWADHSARTRWPRSRHGRWPAGRRAAGCRPNRAVWAGDRLAGDRLAGDLGRASGEQGVLAVGHRAAASC